MSRGHRAADFEGEVQLLLGNEVNDFDKDIQRSISGHDTSVAFGKERSADGFEPCPRGGVTIRVIPYHIHPNL